MENGGTAIGIRCKDGVVLAAEKIITSKLLKPGANKKISTVDRNVGVVSQDCLELILQSSATDGLVLGIFWSSSRWTTFRIKSAR